MRSNIRLWCAVAFAAAVAAGCNCPGNPPAGEDAGEEDAGGTGGGGGGGGGAGGGGGGGSNDAGTIDPNDPTNAQKDSDCDGLNDAEEFSTVYAGGKRTDPAKADSDGDGIKDGVEVGRTSSVDQACGFVGDADPQSRTTPTDPDSDADGVTDGLEDANKDGRLDGTETDPNRIDTDNDGLKDGDEDANKNGQVDAGETDPRKKDSDGDGINDGVERNVTFTDPTRPDTDGDTCSDGAEDTNQNGVVDPGETNPKVATDCGPANNPDTDNDGLPDRVEDVDGDKAYDPPNETDLNNPDTDGDGLKDGVEDKNKNGAVDVGETNPRRKDSDCDGLIDGPTAGATKGEDQNANGLVDTGETDPTKRDSDGDGITDGVESGITANPDPTSCLNVPLDLDPATTTDPTKRDTDGDGIDDGAEDANQNGRVDPGELDPKNPNDVLLPDGGVGPAGKVCTATTLRPVVFKQEGQPDIQLGLPATFTEIATMTVGGQSRGLIGYDPTNKVAFIAWRQAAPGGATNPTADEAALRTTIQSRGALSNVTTQTFTTWDNIPALKAFYDQAGTADVKVQANDLANALVGAGAGALNGTGGAQGPFKLQAEYVHRTNQAVVVVLALTPLANFVEPAIFSVEDAAGGSALAQFGDANATQCETFRPGTSQVDFLFVVDDSCSMAASQQALANTAAAMAGALNNSSLDWRIGMVTTAYYRSSGTNANVLRHFTRNINSFRAWLTQNSTCSANNCSLVPQPAPCNPGGGSNGGCWVSTGGTGNERMLESAAKAVNAITPPTAAEQPTMMRQGAKLVVVVLGDADDQSSYTAQQFTAFFNNTGGTIGAYQNNSGQAITVHGIICPVGQSCNFEPNNDKHGQVITATGGVRGDINDANSISNAIQQIVSATIAAAGHRPLKPPIGASLKVAMDAVQNPATCNKDDLPRSRINGFDFFGSSGTLSFFGDCRPSVATTSAAVSYRYWIDTTPNPGGNPPPCSNDPFYDPADPDFCRGRLTCDLVTSTCVCPPSCGGTSPPGKVCNPNRLVCDFVCTPDCGGSCSGYQTCDVNSCGCVCVQNATCPAGYVFQTSPTCGCVCDTAALSCGPNYDVDPNTCSCVCKTNPPCGGCPNGQACNPSLCSCGGGIN